MILGLTIYVRRRTVIKELLDTIFFLRYLGHVIGQNRASD